MPGCLQGILSSQGLLPLSCCCLRSILSEVMGDMLQEAWAEVDAAQAKADVFAFDLLVAAVAFSSGKYDIGTQVRAQAPPLW